MTTKILVVDDNQDIVFSVKASLEGTGNSYDVTGANSGKECLKMLRKLRPDLLLLDIMMPEMDGWAVAAAIKSDPKLKGLPIIFLTAKTDDLSKGMGSLTAADYIEKPFDAADLDKRIQAALK